MVSFAVFNELSLPFTTQKEAESGFLIFLKLLKILKEEKGVKKIRQDNLLKELKVTQDDWMQSFFCKIKNRELKESIRLLLTNNFISIETPLVLQSDEDEGLLNPSYHYKSKLHFGGLACAEYWNVIALSFKSSIEWDVSILDLNKDGIKTTVRHASDIEHLTYHQGYFNELEKSLKLSITQSNFWQRRGELFTSIIFLDKVKVEVEKLDSIVFSQFISLMLGIETGTRPLSVLDVTGESNTTNKHPKLKKLREFSYHGQKLFFEKHIKNLSKFHRIHFCELDGKLIVGYVGPHLKT